MGIVYKALREEGGLPVALKVLKSDTFSQEITNRFKREARVLTMLKHDAIVTVFETGVHDGFHYIAMEFVDGVTFNRWVADLTEKDQAAQQKVSLDHSEPVDLVGKRHPHFNGSLEDEKTCEMLRVVREVAVALNYAHGLGIVHRDIKPSNILMTSASAPKISDFGLAKDLSSVSHLTATHELLGTPEYMPPEQCRGETGRIGAWSDIYSLGVVLYESLCGFTPHHGTTLFEVLSKIKEDDAPALHKLNSAVDPRLEIIVMKCLERDTARRYASMAELASDIDNLLKGTEISATAPSLAFVAAKRFKKSKTLQLVALGAAIVAVAAVLFHYRTEIFRRKISEIEQKDSRRQAAQKYFDDGRSMVSPLAVTHMTRALEIDPDWAEAWAERGRLHLLLGSPSKALADLARAIEQNPSSPIFHYWIGKTYEKLGDMQNALSHYETAISLHPESTYALLAKAVVLAQRGKYDEAGELCAKVIALDAEIAEAYLVSGVIALVHGDPAAALTDFAKAADIDRLSPAAWNNSGNVYHRQGDLRRALENYNRALKIAPDNPEAIFNRAGVCYQTGRFENAVATWRKFLSFESSTTPLGKATAVQIARTEQLISGAAQPITAEEYCARGCFFALARKFKEAAADFEDALQLEPQIFRAHGYLVQIYEHLAEKVETPSEREKFAQKARVYRKKEELHPIEKNDPWFLPLSDLMSGKEVSLELPPPQK